MHVLCLSYFKHDFVITAFFSFAVVIETILNNELLTNNAYLWQRFIA